MTTSAAPDEMQSPDEATYFKAYEGHATTLRTWLVAYGIGAPVLFLTNAEATTKLAAAPGARCITLLFLVGVALQVGLAALNKTIMWCCYHVERNSDDAVKFPFALAKRMSRWFAIDFLLDVASLVLFSVATWRVFGIFFPGV